MVILIQTDTNEYQSLCYVLAEAFVLNFVNIKRKLSAVAESFIYFDFCIRAETYQFRREMRLKNKEDLGILQPMIFH